MFEQSARFTNQLCTLGSRFQVLKDQKEIP